jgi:hypothetical protein
MIPPEKQCFIPAIHEATWSLHRHVYASGERDRLLSGMTDDDAWMMLKAPGMKEGAPYAVRHLMVSFRNEVSSWIEAHPDSLPFSALTEPDLQHLLDLPSVSLVFGKGVVTTPGWTCHGSDPSLLQRMQRSVDRYVDTCPSDQEPPWISIINDVANDSGHYARRRTPPQTWTDDLRSSRAVSYASYAIIQGLMHRAIRNDCQWSAYHAIMMDMMFSNHYTSSHDAFRHHVRTRCPISKCIPLSSPSLERIRNREDADMIRLAGMPCRMPRPTMRGDLIEQMTSILHIMAHDPAGQVPYDIHVRASSMSLLVKSGSSWAETWTSLHASSDISDLCDDWFGPSGAPAGCSDEVRECFAHRHDYRADTQRIVQSLPFHHASPMAPLSCAQWTEMVSSQACDDFKASCQRHASFVASLASMASASDIMTSACAVAIVMNNGCNRDIMHAYVQRQPDALRYLLTYAIYADSIGTIDALRTCMDSDAMHDEHQKSLRHWTVPDDMLSMASHVMKDRLLLSGYMRDGCVMRSCLRSMEKDIGADLKRGLQPWISHRSPSYHIDHAMVHVLTKACASAGVPYPHHDRTSRSDVVYRIPAATMAPSPYACQSDAIPDGMDPAVAVWYVAIHLPVRHKAWMDDWMLQAWNDPSRYPLTKHQMDVISHHAGDAILAICARDVVTSCASACQRGHYDMASSMLAHGLQKSPVESMTWKHLCDVVEQHVMLLNPHLMASCGHAVSVLWDMHPVIRHLGRAIIPVCRSYGWSPDQTPDVMASEALRATPSSSRRDAVPHPWFLVHGIDAAMLKHAGYPCMDDLGAIYAYLASHPYAARDFWDMGIPERHVIEAILSIDPSYMIILDHRNGQGDRQSPEDGHLHQ